MALAHQPIFSEFPTYDDTYIINDTTSSQVFYGELNGFPHTYRLDIKENQEIKVEVLVPDIEEAHNDRGAIIVRELEVGGVEEVVRLSKGKNAWESFYEPWGGDSYRRGPTYVGELEPGSYLLEVQTAENLGKYVLVLGEMKSLSGLGYFEKLSRIYEIKKFFGKSPISVLQSPIYLLSVITLILIGFLIYRRKKK